MTKTLTSLTDEHSDVVWNAASERFDVLDHKSREIGGSISTRTVTWLVKTVHDAPDDWFSPLEITRRHGQVTYQWSPHATRDGISYGACHRWSDCDTIEERDTAIAAYFASARKRAAKKAAA